MTDLFVNVKNESSTVTLFVGIIYSMRVVLSDLDDYESPTNSDMRHMR